MTTGAPSASATHPITVVIVNYNSGDDLRTCLKALMAQTSRGFDVVVVDNNSADGSVERTDAERAELEATLVPLVENTGFAAGVNRGAELARGDWIATLNPDATPDPNWIDSLTSAIDRYPDASHFGSTQLRAEAPDRLDGCGDSYSAVGLAWRGGFGWPRATVRGDSEVFAPCAAAALYRRDRFVKAGGMEAAFFCYLEDVDLGFRLRLAGGRAIQIADAVVRHKGGAAGGRPDGFEAYHAMRNSLWCFVRNMPPLLMWPLLPACLAVHGLLSLRGGKAARRGWRHGVAGLPRQFKARRRIQLSRTVKTSDIAKWLVWSPLAIRRRAPKRKSV